MTERHPRPPPRITDPPGEERGWIWGNNRGGGGAPLKDPHGNTISDLKQVIKTDHREDDRRRWSPPLQDQQLQRRPPKKNLRIRADEEEDYSADRRRGGDDDYGEYDRAPMGGGRHPQQLRGGDYSERDSPHRRGYDDGPAQVSGAISPLGSPKKFMSALQEMNSSVTLQEKQAKMKRELEYQNALKRQIEEKRQQKEEEKQKEEEIQRREYEEFLAIRGGAAPARTNVSVPKKKPLFKPEDGSAPQDDDQWQEGGLRGGGKNRLPPRGGGGGGGLRLPLDRDQDAAEEEWRRKGRGNGPGRGEYSRPLRNGGDDDYESEPPGGGRRRLLRGGSEDSYDNGYRRGGADDYGGDDNRYGGPRSRASRRGAGDEYVSLEQYDELTALCEKLMERQEHLHSEIKEQAGVIKQLQRGNQVQQVRSKSVQQARQGSDRAGGGVGDRRGGLADNSSAKSKPLLKQRPSSMYQLAPSGRDDDASALARRGVDPKKIAQKVAFGGARVLGDGGAAIPSRVGGKPAGVAGKLPALSKVGGAVLGVNAKGIPRLKPSEAVKQNDLRGGGVGARPPPEVKASRAAAAGAGAGNGFAKLQSRVSGGPMVISHDDDLEISGSNRGSVGGGAGAAAARGNGTGPRRALTESDSNTELRGQSRYIAVGDDDAMHGDQLDRLMTNVKRGKFT